MIEQPLNQRVPLAAFESTLRAVNKRGTLILLVGDTLTLGLFVYVGQRDHELMDAANPLGGLLNAVWPFLLAWFATAFAVGASQVNGAGMRWRTALGRWLIGWLIAAPMGIVLRALWLDRAVIPTTFLLAALGFGGAMLLTWRVLFILIWHKFKRRV